MVDRLRVLLPAFVAGVVTAVLLMTCGGCHGSGVEHPDLRVPAVDRLVAGDPTAQGGLQFHCSVFKLSDDLVGTAGHCCDEGLVYSIGETGAEATVLVDDDTNDVCIMRGRMAGAPIPLAAHDPAIGEAVYNLGFPSGTRMLSLGYWAGRDPQNENLGACSLVVRGGSSGSPVLNMRDQLVGILVAGYRNGDSIAFVANIEQVRFALVKARLIKAD